MPPSDEDRAIDAILEDRDEDAFNLLYERYRSRFFKFLLRLGSGDRDLADELFQESWILALTRLHRFEKRSSFYTWLVGIAINLFRSFTRAARQDETVGRLEPERPERELPDPRLVDRQDLRLDAEAILNQLPDGYRTVLVLHVEGYTHEEIGQLLAISEGTSKSQLSRARQAAHRLIRGDTP